MSGQRFGNEESGFSIALDAGGALRVQAWGFWEPDLSATFARVSVEACRAQRPAKLLFDVTRLKPQVEAGQAAIRALLGSVGAIGISRCVAVVGDNVLTKMQLMRLAREGGARGWTYAANDSMAA